MSGSVRTAFDALRGRLQEALEAQLSELEARQQEDLASARQAVEVEAEQRWSARIDAMRREWEARLESELAAVRSEADSRMAAEAARLRQEAEQAAAESASRARQELDRTLEDALAQARDRAAADLATERQQRAELQDGLQRELDQAAARIQSLTRQVDDLLAARQTTEGELQAARRIHDDERRAREAESGRFGEVRRELESAIEEERRIRQDEVSKLIEARQRVESDLQEERQGRQADARRQDEIAAGLAEQRVAERQGQLATLERLLAALRSMDAAATLTDVLAALAAAASGEAPRTALFVVQGPELRTWKAHGFAELPGSQHVAADDTGLLAEVIRRRDVVVAAAPGDPAPPAFAALPSGRAALAIPLLVAAQAVAVLYADDGGEGEHEAPAAWPEALQIVSRHAATTLAHLTAARAAEAMRRLLSGGPGGVRTAATAPLAAATTAVAADGQSARRYARLLVSEIKLYNEAAVRIGRQKRDLLDRLRPEIERARRLYEQRISREVDARAAFFQEELIQTLADGDPALLGGSA